MSSHDHHAPPSTGDLAYEGFYAAAIGGLVVALFFMLMDLVAGRPLFTPSLIGSVLFFGADAGQVEGVNLTAMALFTLVHLMGFGVVGFVSAFVVRWVESRTGGSFIAPTLVLFLLLEGGFLAFSEIVLPGVGDIVGQGNILIANILAAVAMVWFLRYAHETGESEMKQVAAEGPGEESVRSGI